MTKPKKKAKKPLAKKKAVAKKTVKKTKKSLVKKAKPKKTLKKKQSKKIAKKVVKKPVKKTSVKKKAVKKLASKKVVVKKTTAKLTKTSKPELKQEIKKDNIQIKMPVDSRLNIGDFAVYPAHGVGRIEAMESKTIMGEKMDFMVISIIDTGMNVLVPVKNIESVGLRPVIKSTKVKEVFDVLRNRKRTVTSSTWNRRYREYMEKIKSGSIFEIAEVLRDLLVLKTNKELSFGERKMLDTAKNLLVKELSVAKQIEEKKVETEIQKIFLESKAS